VHAAVAYLACSYDFFVLNFYIVLTEDKLSRRSPETRYDSIQEVLRERALEAERCIVYIYKAAIQTDGELLCLRTRELDEFSCRTVDELRPSDDSAVAFYVH
jgi:hypothetical protein